MKGVYLQSALICERVLEEKHGIISAMRILDSVIHTAPEPFQTTITSLIMVRSDNDAVGMVPIKVKMEGPHGIITSWERMVNAKGQNLVLNMNVFFKEAAPYWFNVYLDDQLATRMPFRVFYMRKDDSFPDNIGIGDFVQGRIIKPGGKHDNEN